MNRIANMLKHVSETFWFFSPSSSAGRAYLWWQCLKVFCCVGVLDSILFTSDKEADLQISKLR